MSNVTTISHSRASVWNQIKKLQNSYVCMSSLNVHVLEGKQVKSGWTWSPAWIHRPRNNLSRVYLLMSRCVVHSSQVVFDEMNFPIRITKTLSIGERQISKCQECFATKRSSPTPLPQMNFAALNGIITDSLVVQLSSEQAAEAANAEVESEDKITPEIEAMTRETHCYRCWDWKPPTRCGANALFWFRWDDELVSCGEVKGKMLRRCLCRFGLKYILSNKLGAGRRLDILRTSTFCTPSSFCEVIETKMVT